MQKEHNVFSVETKKAVQMISDASLRIVIIGMLQLIVRYDNGV